MFVTFEGLDGVGKTTLSLAIKKRLLEYNFNVLYTREPGGTSFSEEVRFFLKRTPVNVCMEFLLQIASRLEHVEQIIRPSMESGAIVLCDRFVDSTIAYQCFFGASKKIEINKKDILSFIDKLLCYNFFSKYTKKILLAVVECLDFDDSFIPVFSGSEIVFVKCVENEKRIQAMVSCLVDLHIYTKSVFPDITFFLKRDGVELDDNAGDKYHDKKIFNRLLIDSGYDFAISFNNKFCNAIGKKRYVYLVLNNLLDSSFEFMFNKIVSLAN